MKEIKDIVIVGGGTAGWMTASTLIKFFPHKQISVIESIDIPTVGVGESTIAEMKDWLKALGIQDKDFMKECDASYKMSIKFTDFYKKDFGSFFYPFGGPYLENTKKGVLDWHVLKKNNSDLDLKDYVRSYYSAAALFEQNKISEKDNFDNFNFYEHVVYHFDAAKFGNWLKEKYAKPKGINHIIGNVKDVVVEEGIKELVMEDGTIHTADLYIDCTGFKSLLLGQALGEEFISKNNVLPNNRAWAVRLPYKDKEKELEPFTNCTAIENGWCWNIPLWSRLGTGYVYSDKYVSPEEALVQFKKYLTSDKMIVKRTFQDLEGLQFNDVRMRVGIHKRTWVKNVAAIGLAAGFIEPLESNGLFTVHEFLFKMIETIDTLDIDKYNKETKSIYDDFLKFISLHYALSQREDTRYWKDMSNNPEITNIKNKYNYSNNGIMCMLSGMNYTYDVDGDIDNISKNLNDNKDRWSTLAKSEPSLYQYLQDNIY